MKFISSSGLYYLNMIKTKYPTLFNGRLNRSEKLMFKHGDLLRPRVYKPDSDDDVSFQQIFIKKLTKERIKRYENNPKLKFHNSVLFLSWYFLNINYLIKKKYDVMDALVKCLYLDNIYRRKFTKFNTKLPFNKIINTIPPYLLDKIVKRSPFIGKDLTYEQLSLLYDFNKQNPMFIYRLYIHSPAHKILRFVQNNKKIYYKMMQLFADDYRKYQIIILFKENDLNKFLCITKTKYKEFLPKVLRYLLICKRNRKKYNFYLRGKILNFLLKTKNINQKNMIKKGIKRLSKKDKLELAKYFV